MFNLDKFIVDSVTFRPVSMFAADIEAYKREIDEEDKLNQQENLTIYIHELLARQDTMPKEKTQTLIKVV